MNLFKERLVVFYADVAASQVCFACFNGFYLYTKKLDTCCVSFYFFVKTGIIFVGGVGCHLFIFL